MKDSIFIGILNMSLIASVVALAVILIRFPLKRAPKIFSYALWGIVLFRLLCPFTFESAMSLLPVNNNAIPQNIGFMQKPAIQTNIPPVDSVVNASISNSLPPVNPVNSVNPMKIVLAVSEMVWLMGIISMLLYVIISYWRIKRHTREATLVDGNMYETDKITSPFVLGFVHPRIYIPVGLPAEQLAYIMAHEQTHIRRLDYLIKPLAFLALTIHWFNPVIWISYFMMTKDMELSCDEAVLRKSGEDIRVGYSKSLLSLSVRRAGLLSPLAFGESNVKSRVRNALNFKKTSMWIIIAAIIAVFVVIAGFAANRKTIVTPQVAIQQLTDSIKYSNGEISFQIPLDYTNTSDWNILISGRAEVNGLSKSQHFFTDENQNKKWERGKTYKIKVEGKTLTDLIMSVYIHGDNGKDIGHEIKLLDYVKPVEGISTTKDNLTSYGWTNGEIMGTQTLILPKTLQYTVQDSPEILFWIRSLELSKDIGYDFTPFLGKSLNVEIHATSGTLPKKYSDFPNNNSRLILLKDNGNIVGAFICYGRHDGLSFSLRGRDFEDITGMSLNDYWQKYYYDTSNAMNTSAQKRTVEQVIRRYFDSMVSQDRSAQLSTLSVEQKIDSLFSNLDDTKLFNNPPQLYSYLSAVRVVSIKPGKSQTSNQNGSDTVEYEITINATTKPDSNIENGVNIRFVTVRKTNAGYCIVEDGTGP